MSLHSCIASNDRGSVSLLASVMIACFMVIAGVVGWASMRVIDYHRAQVAADMSAVSGAYAHYVGDDGCAVARQVAQAHGASVGECVVTGMDIRVGVSLGLAKAQAVAGPV